MDSNLITLRVLSASLKLKFKCRMKVEYANKATRQVEPQQNFYRFNEDMQISVKGTFFELIVTLMTEKGSRYNGGVAKLQVEDMIKNKGKPKKFTINRCIDRQAWIEISLIAATSLNSSFNRQMSFTHNDNFGVQLMVNRQDIFNPDYQNSKNNLMAQSNVIYSRSEHIVGLKTSPSQILKRKRAGDSSMIKADKRINNVADYEMKKNGSKPLSIVYRSDSPSEQYQIKHKFSASPVNLQENLQFVTRRQSLQLKKEQQRADREQAKRKNLEITEHNLKIEIMKLLMNKQQKQREMVKKEQQKHELIFQNNRYKQIQKQLREQLRQQNIQKTAIDQRLSLQVSQITQNYQQTYLQTKQLKAQVQKIKAQMINKNRYIEKLQEHLQKEKDYAKSQQQQMKLMTANSHYLKQELDKQKSNRNDWNNQLIQQKKHQAKEINDIKLQYLEALQEYKQQQKQWSNQKKEMQDVISSLKQDLQRQKQEQQTLQKNRRILLSEIQEYDTKITQLKSFKQKHNQLLQKYRIIKQESSKYKKKFQIAAQECQKYRQSIKRLNSEIQKLKKQNELLLNKNKKLDQKVQLSQIETRNHKSTLQKIKKSEEQIERENLVLREKQKQLRQKLSKNTLEIARLQSQKESIATKLSNSRVLQSDIVRNKFTTSSVEDMQEVKMHGMIQIQKLLQNEIISLKQTNQENKQDTIKMRKQLQSWLAKSYEWKEQQRQLNAQKNAIILENTRINKQFKEIIRKITEEQGKKREIQQKIEKLMKQLKSLQDKSAQLQTQTVNLSAQKQQLWSDKESLQDKLNSLQAQEVVLKSQIQFREKQRLKYLKTIEMLKYDNATKADDLNSLVQQKKQESIALNNQITRTRQQARKLEILLINQIKQGEKHKQKLREIMVDFITAKQKLEKESKVSATQDNPVVISGQLLIRLEAQLRQMLETLQQLKSQLTVLQNQSIKEKQQIIFQRNQHQNSQTQMQLRLTHLLQDFDQIHLRCKEQEQNYNIKMSELEEQVYHKHGDLEQAYTSIAGLQGQIELLTNTMQIMVQSFSKEKERAQKMQLQLKEQEDLLKRKQEQIGAYQELSSNLKHMLEQYNQKQNTWNLEKVGLNRNISDLKEQIEQLGLSIADLQKQKSQLKTLQFNNGIVLEQQVLKLQQQKVDLQDLERQKSQQISLARSLMKQKEELLHQYLVSQQKNYKYENNEVQLRNLIKQLQDAMKANEVSHTNKIQQAKQAIKKLENQFVLQQKLREQMQQANTKIALKLNNAQKLISQTEIQVSRQREKLDKQKSSYNQSQQEWSKEKQYMTQRHYKLTEQANLLQSKNVQQQQKIKSLQEINSEYKTNMDEMTISLNSLQIQIDKQAQKQSAIEMQMMTLTEQSKAFQEQLGKLKQQIQQKQLKNFQLCSDFYQKQKQMQQEMKILGIKNKGLEEIVFKYEINFEEFNRQNIVLKKESENFEEIMNQSQSQIRKLRYRIQVLEEENEESRKKTTDLELQMNCISKNRNKHENQRLQKQRSLEARMTEFKTKEQSLIVQNHKILSDNQMLRDKVARLQPRIQDLQTEYAKTANRYSAELEYYHKADTELRKIKQNWTNCKWKCQREIRMIFENQSNLFNSSKSADFKQFLKSIQESFVEILKKMEIF